MQKTTGFRQWALLATLLMFVTSFQAISIESAPPAFAAQADLTASIEAAGVMSPPSSFNDLTTETFDSRTSLAAGTTLSIGTVRDMSGTFSAQSGGTNASPTNTTYSVSGTVRATGDAVVWGGTDGTGKYASVTTSSGATTNVGGMRIELNDHAGESDDTYRYVGFWWSAGNSPNIVRLINDGTETATFTTVNLLAQLGTAPGSPYVTGDYFGNPSRQFNSDARVGSCPSTNPATTCVGGGENEPYAYIHLRLSTGFDEIQFAGRGFEFDSISVRRFVPSSSDSETSIVGAGVVGSCSGFSNQNAQYVLRNGSFEDNYLTNAAGTTNAALSAATTSDTSADIARWVRYSGGPYQFMGLYEAEFNGANRVPFWQTTASDQKIELQRQVAGSESSAARNGSLYFDLFGPRPADGSVHAEINANERAALYQDLVTIGGQRITWSIKHRGRFFGSGSTSQSGSSTASNDVDKFEILIGPSTGTLVAQTPARKRLPDTVWNTANVTYVNNAFADFSTNTTGHTAQTMYTRLEEGWVLYTGTYTVPANQTSTRFSFSSRGTGSGGNLIDDIGFDLIVACPRTVTIQRNASTDLPIEPLTDSQIPNYTYPDTTTVTAATRNSGTGRVTLTSGTSAIQLGSDTVGNFQVLYTLTDINSQTSQSTITVNVEDAATQLPQVLLVDPRATSISLPSQTLSGSTNAMLCIQQVNSASATTLTGSPTISIGRSTNVANVTFAEATNLWRFTGTRTNVQTQVPSITINGVGTNPIVATGSKFVRVGVTAATTLGTGACYLGQSRVIELRSLALAGSVIRSVDLD
jgi:hypothetical protein